MGVRNRDVVLGEGDTPQPTRGNHDGQLWVRGSGGCEFPMDVPTDPARLEVFHDQLRKGDIVILDGDTPEPEAPPAPPVPEQPAKNASTEAWQTYALAMGMDAAEVELASRDELVELLADPEPAAD